MPTRGILLTLFLFVVGVIAGCSPGPAYLGNIELRRGNYERTDTHFRRAVAEDSDNVDARRGMGQALYHLEDYERAAAQLEAVLRVRPDDGQATLYLGMTRERQGDFTGARQAYEDYLDLGRKSSLTRQIKGRRVPGPDMSSVSPYVLCATALGAG